MLLIFFEGTADVLVVIMALDLLHLSEGSVGFLNAGLGIGALVGGAGLSLLLERGRLVLALAGGASSSGSAPHLPAAWPVAFAAYAGWIGVGLGYTLVEVAAKTLIQRLGSDETLGRVVGSLESARLAAMASGSIGASLLVELLGVRGALLALGARSCRSSDRAAGPACAPSRSGRRSPRSTSSCCAATRSSRRCRWPPWSGSGTTSSR